MPNVDDVVSYQPYNDKYRTAYGLVVDVHTYRSGNTYAHVRFIGRKGLGEKVYSYLAKRVTPLFSIQDLRELADVERP